MAYVNLGYATKQRRAQQIVTDLSSSGKMGFYNAAPPLSPDLTATGTLLASLNLNVSAGIVSQGVSAFPVVFGGSRGTAGTYNLGISGTWTNAPVATFTVANGSVRSIDLVSPGSGVSAVTNISFATCPGITGASAEPLYTAVIWFNAIPQGNAIAGGTIGYCRLTNAGGAGIVDMDVGVAGSGASVIVNATVVTTGSPLLVTQAVLFES